MVNLAHLNSSEAVKFQSSLLSRRAICFRLKTKFSKLNSKNTTLRMQTIENGWRYNKLPTQEHFPRATGGGDNSGGGSGPPPTGGEGNNEENDEPEQEPGQGSPWRKYLSLLESHPLLTKSVTSMLINMAGDLLCQIEVEKSQVDLKRTVISGTLGLLLVGPTLHYWYSTLGSLIPWGGTAGAAAQLFLDQAVFSPVFICAFFSALLTLEGRPQDIIPKLKQEWGTTVINNWKLWIPFQFINFRLVPPNLRVGFANLVALGWNVYLSFAGHTQVPDSA